MKQPLLLLTILTCVLTASSATAEDHDDHDVVIGLTDSQQLTVDGDHALSISLEYNSALNLYYGGQACWIPAEGDLHIMTSYGDGTPPTGHYALELAVVDMPASVMAFESETFSQILNGQSYALDGWNWQEEEGWHFHQHISWALDPARVTAGETVTASFKLIDTTGQYADSEVFDVSLTAVPEPATVGLLALGAAFLKRRRG